ncbi:SgcJ/EcaC family oxidoreductase [Nannocystis punicea]|uniref:SgcJ/EcaC family oxidoreductase n=1 Tax=Nannocystis punicea TaxID=2995304 RepID=A0ABY7GT01_9BACT|nr:SgcJ/EcaC family oxidoreductase [Nannocystis poenicansa]WAS90088.1 SgcJ/EcaC family oxidoreductase [Nannocystis poenicansa]
MNDDARDIREHVLRTWEAWGRGDARAYAALFAPEVDYVAFDGSIARGREEVERGHAALFSTVLRATALRGEVEDVRLVGADAAVAHALGAVVWPWQQGLPPDRLSRQTYVLVRAGEGWTIAAFHNTRVRPVPPPGSPGFKVFAWFVRLRLRLHGVGG